MENPLSNLFIAVCPEPGRRRNLFQQQRAKELVRRRLSILFCALLLSCSTDGRLRQPQTAEQTADSRELQQIFERYFEDYLQLFPTFATSIGDHRFDDQFEISISEEHLAKQRELYLKSLAALAGIKTATARSR